MKNTVFIEVKQRMSNKQFFKLKKEIKSQISEDASIVVVPYGIEVKYMIFEENAGLLENTYVEQAPKCLNCIFNTFAYIDLNYPASSYYICNLEGKEVSCEGICDYHVYNGSQL